MVEAHDQVKGKRTKPPDERTSKRLRPPFLAPFPQDNLTLEEARRTMWTCYILDVYESSSVGWPSTLNEAQLRLYLPCAETNFNNGTLSNHSNIEFWPENIFGTPNP